MNLKPESQSKLTKVLKAAAHNVTSVTGAGLDHYHAVKSMNENGAIAHHGALARVLLNSGDAKSEADAVSMASTLIMQVHAIDRGELRHREARLLLDADARDRAQASPKAVQPSFELVGNRPLRVALG